MISKSQPEFTGLAVPTYIVFQAATATKSVYLCAYSTAPDRVVKQLQRTIQQAGGVSVCQPIASESYCPKLLVGAQLPGLSSSDLWMIRAAIERAGGMIETVRVNYQIRRPNSGSQERPKACVGCQYYYGLHHGNVRLICAMHPYGSSDDTCREWEAINEDK